LKLVDVTQSVRLMQQ